MYVKCDILQVQDAFLEPVRHASSACLQDISRGTPDTSGGFWKLTYTDANFRVLYSNKGNVFVLARE